MRIRTIAVLAAALALPLTACAAEEDTAEPEAKPSATVGAPVEKEAEDSGEAASSPPAKVDSGIPKGPTGQARTGYLDALRAIDPWFVDDKGEEDAIDNGRNQCSSLDGDRAVWSAQKRFGKGPLREVTEAEAKKINEAVRKYICPNS
ncbi:hypothetical protein [Streptomyces gobiensis]|uniref:hypothetical protein n=1 Tax=Streptomyces gobiensis TaxID=2875706 RepID=UPI001E3BED9F|nr:hypothetical protein [Streptomyces gobiensis]UGY92773.1 hypothetical protein test1122_14310 [Streptomyces gobiensis]